MLYFLIIASTVLIISALWSIQTAVHSLNMNVERIFKTVDTIRVRLESIN